MAGNCWQWPEMAGWTGQAGRVGVAAWLGAALCSAFASVYFEKMVKLSPGGEPVPSLWLRNIQLCSLSCLTGVLLVAEERAAWREGSTLRTHGPLHNFDRFVALFILLGGSGGITVDGIYMNATGRPTLQGAKNNKIRDSQGVCIEPTIETLGAGESWSGVAAAVS